MSFEYKVSFASDNYAPAFPEIIDQLKNISSDHCPAYGADELSLKAQEKVSMFCGGAKKVLFTFNGTGANLVSLGLAAHPGSSVLCSEYSHIAVDEGGAPEALLGLKLRTLKSADAKIYLKDLEAQRVMDRQTDKHASQVSFISLSMSSEYGTVYSLQELEEICEWAKKHQIFVHVDGARILNAAAYLKQNDLSFLKKAGVDVLSFGGTKAGLLYGEAVVIWNETLSIHGDYVQKRLLQLSSKMRYISQQFISLLEDSLGLERARFANHLAQELERQLRLIPNLRVTQKVQANVVFVELPKKDLSMIQKKFPFYIWNTQTNEARLMCSWNLTLNDIHNFVNELKKGVL